MLNTPSKTSSKPPFPAIGNFVKVGGLISANFELGGLYISQLAQLRREQPETEAEKEILAADIEIREQVLEALREQTVLLILRAADLAEKANKPVLYLKLPNHHAQRHAETLLHDMYSSGRTPAVQVFCQVRVKP